MPYIRKMRPERSALGVKDGTEKVYYSSDELGKKLRKRILESSIEFKKEILKKEKRNNNKTFKPENIFNKKIAYV